MTTPEVNLWLECELYDPDSGECEDFNIPILLHHTTNLRDLRTKLLQYIHDDEPEFSNIIWHAEEKGMSE